MSVVKKTLAVGASSLLAVGGVASIAGMALAENAPADQGANAAAEAVEVSQETAVVYVDAVEGDFAFTQTEVASNDQIKKYIGDASKYLCNGSVANDESVAPEDWKITLKGDVQKEKLVDFGDLVKSDKMQSLIMGCSCLGNPTDGSATVNAEVTGIPMSVIYEMVELEDGVNTVVFTSTDGYSVAMPLRYVLVNSGMIVFDVNGAKLADSIGGSNQLWLGGTAASYFARDIDTITFEVRAEEPLSPSSDEAREAYQNLPNVGIFYGGDIL